MAKKKKTTRGGYRANAGRPPKDPAEKLVKQTVRLLPAEWSYLEDAYGNSQEGIRELVRKAMSRN